MKQSYRTILRIMGRIIVNALVIFVSACVMVRLQHELLFSRAMFSHKELVGLSVVFGLTYLVRVRSSKMTDMAGFVLFTLFAIGSLPTVNTAAFVATRDFVPSLWYFAFASWVSLTIVVSLSQSGYRYKTTTLYSWYGVAVASAYIGAAIARTQVAPFALAGRLPALALAVCALVQVWLLLKDQMPKQRPS